MQFTAADEGRHDDAPGVESWAFALDGASAAGEIRLTIDAEHRRAAFVVDLVLARVGRVVVADESVPMPRPTAGLEIRADGLWASLYCETPFEHWTLGLEAFGLRVERDASAPTWDDLVGERLPVGFDLEWEVAEDPEPVVDGAGYRQVGPVHGDVLVATDRLDIAAPAVREHWWGVMTAPSAGA